MGSAVVEAQLDKKPYRNQTQGWLGVVKLSHLGEALGEGIAPGAVVYLSDAEAQLTARAPRDPKDNPFEEQIFPFIDNESGREVQAPLRPLVLVINEEGLPSEDRYVPGITDVIPPSTVDIAALAAARSDAQNMLAGDSERDATIPTEPVEPQLASSAAAAVPPSQATRTGAISTAQPQPPEDDVARSWTENPSRTAQPQAGSLGGSDEPAPKPPEGTQEKAPEGGQPGAVAPQAPAPQTVASSSVEETAAHLGSGEETGAAEQPAGEAPEGEFAAHEEVGSPDAPAQGGE